MPSPAEHAAGLEASPPSGNWPCAARRTPSARP